MDQYVAAFVAEKTGAEGNSVFVIVATIEVHRHGAGLGVDDNSVPSFVYNDGGIPTV